FAARMQGIGRDRVHLAGAGHSDGRRYGRTAGYSAGIQTRNIRLRISFNMKSISSCADDPNPGIAPARLPSKIPPFFKASSRSSSLAVSLKAFNEYSKELSLRDR